MQFFFHLAPNFAASIQSPVVTVHVILAGQSKRAWAHRFNPLGTPWGGSGPPRHVGKLGHICSRHAHRQPPNPRPSTRPESTQQQNFCNAVPTSMIQNTSHSRLLGNDLHLNSNKPIQGAGRIVSASSQHVVFRRPGKLTGRRWHKRSLAAGCFFAGSSPKCT